jgi:hypothetical protein
MRQEPCSLQITNSERPSPNCGCFHSCGPDSPALFFLYSCVLNRKLCAGQFVIFIWNTLHNGDRKPRVSLSSVLLMPVSQGHLRSYCFSGLQCMVTGPTLELSLWPSDITPVPLKVILSMSQLCTESTWSSFYISAEVFQCESSGILKNGKGHSSIPAASNSTSWPWSGGIASSQDGHGAKWSPAFMS